MTSPPRDGAKRRKEGPCARPSPSRALSRSRACRAPARHAYAHARTRPCTCLTKCCDSIEAARATNERARARAHGKEEADRWTPLGCHRWIRTSWWRGSPRRSISARRAPRRCWTVPPRTPASPSSCLAFPAIPTSVRRVRLDTGWSTVRIRTHARTHANESPPTTRHATIMMSGAPSFRHLRLLSCLCYSLDDTLSAVNCRPSAPLPRVIALHWSNPTRCWHAMSLAMTIHRRVRVSLAYAASQHGSRDSRGGRDAVGRPNEPRNTFCGIAAARSAWHNLTSTLAGRKEERGKERDVLWARYSRGAINANEMGATHYVIHRSRRDWLRSRCDARHLYAPTFAAYALSPPLPPPPPTPPPPPQPPLSHFISVAISVIVTAKMHSYFIVYFIGIRIVSWQNNDKSYLFSFIYSTEKRRKKRQVFFKFL